MMCHLISIARKEALLRKWRLNIKTGFSSSFPLHYCLLPPMCGIITHKKISYFFFLRLFSLEWCFGLTMNRYITFNLSWHLYKSLYNAFITIQTQFSLVFDWGKKFKVHPLRWWWGRGNESAADIRNTIIPLQPDSSSEVYSCLLSYF